MGVLSLLFGVAAWVGYIWLCLNWNNLVRDHVCSGEAYVKMITIDLYTVAADFVSLIGLILGVLSRRNKTSDFTKYSFVGLIGCLLTASFIFLVTLIQLFDSLGIH